jgi:2-polyprenyl-3-methyl-5-hydroxy-6-metoxy-1,4-benzoquinol methylase
MAAMSEQVARNPQYEKFADEFLEHAADGFYNAYIDRPACLDLLGDVAGKHVLDAACGPGLYAAELVARGARVTGFDQSTRMISLCRDRVPTGEFRVHDLAEPRPLPEAAAANPERYQKFSRSPYGFIAFRLLPR